MNRCICWYPTPLGGTCLKEILHVCSGEEGAKCYLAPDPACALADTVAHILEEHRILAHLTPFSASDVPVRQEHMEELQDAVFALEEHIRSIAREEAEKIRDDWD